SSTIYVGTNNGIFRSTDRGATWGAFNTGLPVLTDNSVTSLAIDRTGTGLHFVKAGTVFDYQILSGALDISVDSRNQARLLFTEPDDRLTLRTVDHSGNVTGGPYGPYSGWSPNAVADGPEGLTRVLWNNLDGSAALWLVDAQGGNRASHQFGPVPGWTAVDVAARTARSSHCISPHPHNTDVL